MQETTFSIGERTPISVRLQLAQDEKTDAATLDLLSQDKRWQVRAAVAAHLQTPSTILKQLSEDETDQVVLAVIQNPNCTDVIFEHLSHSTSPTILRSLLSKTQLSHYCVSTIFMNWRVPPAVRRDAALHPHLPLHDAKRAAETCPRQFLANPSFPLWLVENPNFLQSLWSNGKSNVARIAQDPSILRALLDCGDVYTWKALYKNPFLDQIAPHMRREIYQKAIDLLRNYHPDESNFPINAIAALCKSIALDVNTPADLIHALVALPSIEVTENSYEEDEKAEAVDEIRHVALQHPCLTAEFLTLLYHDEKNLRMRYQQENPETDIDGGEVILRRYDLGVLAAHRHFPRSLLADAFSIASSVEKRAFYRFSPITTTN